MQRGKDTANDPGDQIVPEHLCLNLPPTGVQAQHGGSRRLRGTPSDAERSLTDPTADRLAPAQQLGVDLGELFHTVIEMVESGEGGAWRILGTTMAVTRLESQQVTAAV